jgi:hypothetical protein
VTSGRNAQQGDALGSGAEALARALAAGPGELRVLFESSWQNLAAVVMVFWRLAHRALGPSPTLADFSAYAREVARLCEEYATPLNPLVAEAFLRCTYLDDHVVRNIPSVTTTRTICDFVYSIVVREGLDAAELAAEAWDTAEELDAETMAAEVWGAIQEAGGKWPTSWLSRRSSMTDVEDR